METSEQQLALVIAKSNLPAREKQALMSLLGSPKEYYRGLVSTSVNDALNAPDITLSIIKRTIGLQGARAAVVIALSELVSFFNVSQTMDAEQVALTTDMILETYWYFKIEDIKCCFRRAMHTADVYGRLDGNTVFRWLREYDLERDQTIEAQEIAKNEIFKSNTPAQSTPNTAVSFDQFTEILKEKAASGDKDAQETLATISNLSIGSSSWNETKEKDFKEYLREYRLKKFAKK